MRAARPPWITNGSRREVLEAAQAVDAQEDALYGERRGDELPPELATSNGRQKWLANAKRWLDDQRAEQAAAIPRERPQRVKEAKRRLDEELWTEICANAGYERYRAKGVDRRGGRLGPNTLPQPYTPPEVPQGPINTTDLDSRMVKGQHGWLQGYNAQAAINEHRIVIAAEIAVVSPDFGHLAPMVAAARRELPPPRSRTLRRSSLRTRATGTPSRCTSSPPTASRS